MKLYIKRDDFRSHRVVLFVLAKGIDAEFVELTDEAIEQLLPLNPNRFYPILEDKEFCIAGAPLVMEYLEDRFPFTPLFPHIPKLKATFKFMMSNFQKLFCRYIDVAESAPAKKSLEAKKALQHYAMYYEDILTSHHISENGFSVLDCFMIPTIYKLEQLGIDLSKSKKTTEYIAFHKKQDYFQKSLDIISFASSDI